MIKNLCETCKTGLDSLKIDSSSVECPYISCHDGKRCTMYVKIAVPGAYDSANSDEDAEKQYHI